jgi:hypothetical protein
VSRVTPIARCAQVPPFILITILSGIKIDAYCWDKPRLLSSEDSGFCGRTTLSFWLRLIPIPIPVLVLLVLLPGFAFRATRRGRLKESELHVRWPWWRR